MLSGRNWMTMPMSVGQMPKIGRTSVFALAISLGLGMGSDGRAVTMEEAVRAALKTNPDIGAVVENRRAVNHELSQARSGFLPTVDFNSSTGKEYANNSTTRARQLDGNDSRTTSLQTTSFGLTIRQLLFDGFDTLSQVERQEGRVRSAARRVRETSEFIGQDAVEGYLESLRQRELITINEENVRAHEIFLELVRARVAGGAAGKAEEEQAQQRLAAARDAVTQADGLRRDADARYRRIVGEEPLVMNRPNVPVDALPSTVDQAIDLAIQFNPTIRVSRSDVQIAEAEMKQTNSSYWPQLSFEVNANSNRNSGGTRGQDTTVSALLVMNYNLYRGGSDIARRSEFVARLAEARQRLAQSQRATDENTRVAWNALINARERLTQLEAIVKANANIRDSFKKEFDVGRRDLLDLLNAENDYFQAKGNLVSNQFVEMLGVYRILSSTGLLLAALDVEQSRESFVSDSEGASFQNTLQKFVEATPVLNFQKDGADAVPGQAGPALAPPILRNSPVLDPLAPLQGGGVDLMSPVGAPLAPPLNPSAPLSGGPVLTPAQPLMTPAPPLLDPNAPVLDPNAPALDPNAPLLDPTQPVPGVPQGPRPQTETGKPTPLLRQAKLVNEDIAPPTAFVDKPRLTPLPGQLGLRNASDAVPNNATLGRDETRRGAPDGVWWFGPASGAVTKSNSDQQPQVKKKSVKPSVWGFD